MNSKFRPTTESSRARRRRLGAGLTVLPLAVLAFANPVGAIPSDKTGGPPGNNGTVKIDGEGFNNHPNNDPHVGCEFEVDFYGFDEGDLNAVVTFTVQPPTGKADVLLTDTLEIGEDDNSGGGSEAGHDATGKYDLSTLLVGAYPEHPQQGYHVKLTVNADGSKGADTKHKVFWVRDCTLPTTPPLIPSDNPGDTPTVDATDSPAADTAVLGETLTKPDVAAPAAEVPATVAGEQLAAPVGGVHTGGGGTSGGTNPLLPFAAALAFLGLAGYVTPRLGRIG